MTRLARIAMRKPAIRDVVRERTRRRSPAAVPCTRGTTCSGRSVGCSASRRATRAPPGWCEVAAVRKPGVRVYATILGSPSREQRNADLAALLRWGLSRYRVASVITQGRTYALAQAGYGRAPLELVTASRVRRAVRIDRPLVARVVATAAVKLPVHAGERLGVIRIYEGKRLVAARPLVAGRTIERPGVAGRVGFYARGPRSTSRPGSHDRHRHAQRGRRPHADRPELPARPPAPRERGLDARRRQGDQRRAHAQGARRAGRRDGARRRPDGHAHRRGPDERGDPQRLRPHRRRVAHVDDGRRPRRRNVDGDLRVGAAREPRRARDAAREDRLSRAGGRPRCVLRLAAAGRRSTASTPRRSASSPVGACAPCSTPRESRYGWASRRSRGSCRRTSEKRRASSARSSTTRRTS